MLTLIGTTCNDCMTTIKGPYQNGSEDPINSVNVFEVNKLESAEFFCKFICHDSDHTKYNYRVFIDILYQAGYPKRVMNMLTNLDAQFEASSHYNFSYINNKISSCETNNVTIYTTQIVHFSVSSDTPTLIAKCAVEYFPNGRDNRRNANCSSSSSTTFAIIPNYTIPTPTSVVCSSSTATTYYTSWGTSTWPTSTPTLPTVEPPSTSPTVGLSNTLRFTSREFGLTVGILSSIVTIETVLLIIFVYLLMKCNKYRESSSNEVFHNHTVSHDAENDTPAGPCAPNNDMAM